MPMVLHISMPPLLKGMLCSIDAACIIAHALLYLADPFQFIAFLCPGMLQ